MMTNLMGDIGDESEHDSSTISTDIDESASEAPLAEEHVSEAQERINASLVGACKHGDYGAIKAHLDAGGSPNIRGFYNQEVALIEAARYGHRDIAGLLLNSGANPDIKNTYNQTALMWAVKEGHNDIAELLLDNGANPTLTNDHNDTALLWATESLNVDGIKLLLNKGVSVIGEDGKLLIVGMFDDNIGLYDRAKRLFAFHTNRLQEISTQMINGTICRNSYMLSEASKYSRSDMLYTLENKEGVGAMSNAVEIYDRAMNSLVTTELNELSISKRARYK